ncbi:F-box domain containing protein [Trichuris trichiura]|uniref:F-box domain containing protein n=1 Tax=Trichuris trichiura TaxID=36087 RepID=A0A077YWE7_TRITR|nr:F-box domain containing protein [Trichuris trichiura]
MSERDDSSNAEQEGLSRPYILNLPLEIIVSIVKLVDQSDWMNLAMVNTQFRAAVILCLRPLTNVTLSQFLKPTSGFEAENHVIFILQALISVKFLIVPASILPAIRSQVARCLSRLKRLKSLNISGCVIREAVLCKLLHCLPQLEELSLRGAYIPTSLTDYDQSTLLFMLQLDVYECYTGRDALGILISKLPELMELGIQFQLP